MADAFDIEEVPEGKIARFHYEEQYSEMMQEYLQELRSRGIPAPTDGFDVPYPDRLTSATVTDDDVEDWLRRISFGKDTVRLLMDAGARYIGAVEIWPTRTEQGVLQMWTVGVSMMIRWDDLVRFLDEMSAESDEYFNIEAIRIVNQNLNQPATAPLQVEMVFTRADYDETGRPGMQQQQQPPFMMGGGGGGGFSFPGM